MNSINTKKRKFISPEHMRFLRMLPCQITGQPMHDRHHVDVIGMSRVQNDYYALPLTAQTHDKWHRDPAKLTEALDEDPRDRIIFILSMELEAIYKRYKITADIEMGYMDYQRKLRGE
jgi:hypothetical protein